MPRVSNNQHTAVAVVQITCWLELSGGGNISEISLHHDDTEL